MSLHFITDDAERWGTGQNRPLTAAELDDTIWTLKVATDAASAAGPVSIEAVRVVGGASMYVDLTDSTTQGPFALPVARINGRGAWAPDTLYAVNDAVSYGNKAYSVLYPHTSAATFSEGATDGDGNLVYGLFIEISDSIPDGGDQGMVLVKKTSTSRDVKWAYQIGILPEGAIAGQVLSANSGTYADASWKSSINLPLYEQTDISGDVTLDYANGECQRLNLIGDVTSLTIDNFGVAGRTFKMTLEVWGGDAYSLTWPAEWLWGDGYVPTLGAKALIVLVTLDGGATIYVNPVGSNYQLAV